MKKELPIAVFLLALGAWCWLQLPSDPNDGQSHFASAISSPEATAHSISAGRPRQTAADHTGPLAWPVAGDVVQASWESPTLGPTTEKKTEVMRDFPPEAFLAIANADDAGATAAISRITAGLQQAPAFATLTTLKSRLFDVTMAATGKYFQTTGGQKSRMEIQCHSPVAQTVLHMSDGRFVYILKSDHQQQRLEFIDLFRLANRRGNAEGGLLPTTWVMGGGIGESFAHYAEAFDFQIVPSALKSQATQEVITLRGIWKAATLLHLINAGKPPEHRPTKVVWSQVPRQLPHCIELTFATAAGQPTMPKQISFFQFRTQGKISSAQEMVRIEFNGYEFRKDLPDELFTLESTDFEAIDMTRIYNSKIATLRAGTNKVADQSPPSATLR